MSRSNRFKDLKIYYFHNCIDEYLYTNPTLRLKYEVSTQKVLRECDKDYKVCLLYTSALGHPSHRFEGGYPEAERQVCVFLPDWLEPEDELPEPYGLAALRAVWYEGDTLGHRDILGALMGLGIRRETVGDLLVSEHSCDILLLPEILPYLRENFTQAGRVKLKLSEISLSELSVPPIAKKIIQMCIRDRWWPAA